MAEEETESDKELPRGSYDIFATIINGFLSVGGDRKGVSTAEIADYIGRHHTLVSQNIKAIIAFNIATRVKGYKYKLTPVGADLAYSLEYKDEEGVRSAYRRIISDSEFLKSIVFAVNYREGYQESDLKDHIAKLVKVRKKDARATTGAQTVIEILLNSGFLEKEGNTIVPTGKISSLLKEDVSGEILKPEIESVGKEEREVRHIPTHHIERPSPVEMSIRLNFDIPIDANDNDLKSIVKSIRYIQKEVKEGEKGEEV